MSQPPQDGESATTDGSAGPFLGALTIIVAVVIAIWLFSIFSGPDDSEEQQVGRAVVAQNDALQRQDFADFQAVTCPGQQGKESEVLDRQRNSSQERGERFVDGVTRVILDGDRATAEVTYHFKFDPEARETVEATFEREAGTWKVCSTGPS